MTPSWRRKFEEFNNEKVVDTILEKLETNIRDKDEKKREVEIDWDHDGDTDAWERNERTIAEFVNKEKFISKLVKGVKPIRVDGNERFYGLFAQEIDGWKVLLEPWTQVDKGKVISAEYESVTIIIAKIDNKRNLEYKADRIYGEHLAVQHEDCSSFLGAKFDLKFKTSKNPKGLILGEDLYDFAGELIELSKSMDCGIGVKNIKQKKNGELKFHGGIHIYPRFQSSFKNNKMKIQMGYALFYREGYELWGNRIGLNKTDDKANGVELKIPYTTGDLDDLGFTDGES